MVSSTQENLGTTWYSTMERASASLTTISTPKLNNDMTLPLLQCNTLPVQLNAGISKFCVNPNSIS